MPISRGRDMLLKVEDAPGTFLTVGGLRVKSMSLSTSTVDVTNADSARWRELLPAAGLREVSISGTGLFIDDAAVRRVRTIFFDGATPRWQMRLPQVGVFDGPFQLSSLDLTGDFRAEVTFAITLSSAGVVTFTEEAA